LAEAVGSARTDAQALVTRLQERICARALESEQRAEAGGGGRAASFTVDDWTSGGGGGAIRGIGSTRLIGEGAVFERGGVNTSIVTGPALPPSVVAQRPELAGHGFFAAGVSVVMHPRNPHAPTAHCNYRYFEAAAPDGTIGAWWLGGGSDLTPYYPHLDDVRHFHRTLKLACDRHDAAFYPAFKAWCDRYFYLRHRSETRGVGGIFYDYLDEGGFGESGERAQHARPHSIESLFAFMADAGNAFADAYFPIVDAHALDPVSEGERSFQLMRRGRYVEFNLLYDRGTTFGLQSGGRTESILMSLPPLVRWAYNETPAAGTREAELAGYLRPRDWFAPDPLAP
jgi:coproporphyrinogen III oxidase